MREKEKQINNLIQKINEKYQDWLDAMDKWVDHQDNPMPSLPVMVEDLLNHLRGLDKSKASEYEWMMIL